jgi:hypothetical protein
VRFALSAVSSNGTTYRLAVGSFAIAGATTMTVNAEDHLPEAFINEILPTGSYTVTLADGWQLQRFVDGSFVNVDASLVSANPASFTVTEGQTTDLAFQFQSGGDTVVVGTGLLKLSVVVSEACPAVTLGAFSHEVTIGNTSRFRAPVLGLSGAGTNEDYAILAVNGDSGALSLSAADAMPLFVLVDANGGVVTLYTAVTGTLNVAASSEPVTHLGLNATLANVKLIEGDPETLLPIAGGKCLILNSAVVDVAPRANIPSGWTCGGNTYGASDGCDCNCGGVDPDCSVALAPVLNCLNNGATCDSSGACVGGVVLPSTWTCARTLYGAGDGKCDCGCGAYDPDCDSAGATVSGCTGNAVCSSTGICTGGFATPASWTCDATYFGANDGCDCNCGAWDLDCNTSGVATWGCNSGQSCVAPGVCL